MGITLLFVLIGIGIWFEVKDDRYRDMAYSSIIIDNYFGLSFQQRDISLRILGNRMLEIEGPERDSIRFSLIAEALNNYRDMLAIGLADTTGQIITFTGDSTSQNLHNLTDSSRSRRSFLAAKSAQQLLIGEAYYFERVNDWIVPIRVPLRDNEGNLLALNTAAVSIDSLIKQIKSFGFDNRYHFQVVNGTYNITQFYSPLNKNLYGSIVGKSAEIYENVEVWKEENAYEYFSAFNKISQKPVLGVRPSNRSQDAGHYMIINVEKSILGAAFQTYLTWLLIIYFSLLGIVIVLFLYLRGQEKKFNRSIEEERDYSNFIIKGSPVLIVGINLKGVTTFMNPKVTEITGYSESELLGRNWWKIMYPSDQFHQVEKLLEEFEKGDISNYLMTLITKDQSKRTISWNSQKILDRKGEIREIIGFGNDVTELNIAQSKVAEYTENLEKLVDDRTVELMEANRGLLEGKYKLEEKQSELQKTLKYLRETQKTLIQSEKMASLGILSAGIGHEINNPLNFIKGGIHGIETLFTENLNPSKDELKVFVDIINQGVDRANNIVKSLSHFSRSGHSMEENCFLPEIVDNCLIILNNKIKKRIEVLKRYEENLPSIKGSEGKLHQAVLNILSNSIQAIKGEGNIRVDIHKDNNWLVTSILDDGEGISAENLKNIHDPFFTTKPPGEGTGLGLAITYTILEEHNGKIIVNSELKKGTEVLIKLPIN